MNTEMDSLQQKRRSALDYLEEQIDIWHQTAHFKKSIINTWRRRITIYMLVGAAFGLLSQQINQIEVEARRTTGSTIIGDRFILGEFDYFQIGFELHEMLATLSAIAVALATFAGTRVLSNNLEKSQLKAHAAAESLKVQAYLYAMKAPPYSSKNAEKILFERVEVILKEVDEITPEMSKVTQQKRSKLSHWLMKLFLGKGAVTNHSHQMLRFSENMTFEEYMNERVIKQIHEHYRLRAAKFQRIINNANAATLIFGFLGVAIGTIGATTSPGISMWIGLLSTSSASIASYIHAGKYEQKLLTYVSTASKLELVSARFKSMAQPNPKMHQRFVSETETIFSSENNSWISEITESLENEAISNLDAENKG
ncbi:MAG: DUF4231 domain-containing protein [Fluviicola sp.]